MSPVASGSGSKDVGMSSRAAGDVPRARKRPGRAPVSCAECRRLKLKCDRKLPCSKCVQRGCAAICPDGSLTTGKGNRLILANTTELHERIETLCVRVRQLEDGLRTLQASVSGETHPLLSEELLGVKNGGYVNVNVGAGQAAENTAIARLAPAEQQQRVDGSSADTGRGVAGAKDEEEVMFDSFGTLSIGLYGEARFLGQTARADLLLHDESSSDDSSTESETDSPSTPPYACVYDNLYGATSQNHSTSFASVPGQHRDRDGTQQRQTQTQATYSPFGRRGRGQYASQIHNQNQSSQASTSRHNNDLTSSSSSAASASHSPPSTSRPEHVDAHPSKLPSVLTSFHWPESPPVPPESLREMVYDYLPSLEEACVLCEIYLRMGVWMGLIVSKTELYDSLIGSVYRPLTIETVVCPHKLSLLLSIFAIASLFDLSQPPHSQKALMYYQLAKVAITFKDPVGETTLAAVQSLGNMVRWLDVCEGEVMGVGLAGHSGNGSGNGNGLEVTEGEKWVIVGVLVRLATSMGLHHDSSRWKLDEKLARRRHRTFWQIYAIDIKESLIYGRPPCLSDHYIDCPLPDDLEPEHETHTLWTLNFFRLVRSISSEAFGTSIPSYLSIMAMDRKLREFGVPAGLVLEYTDETAREAKDAPERILMRWCVLQIKESVLLNLHRTSFAKASELFPQNLLNCKYGPSVLACYRSAFRLIESVEWVYKHVPGLAPRIVCYYAGAAFSATVMCLIVVRVPTSTLAPAAMEKLNAICEILEGIADSSRIAKRNLRAVQKMQHKARQALSRATSVSTEQEDQDMDAFPAEQTDDLHRLGGKTRLVSMKLKKEPCIAIISPTVNGGGVGETWRDDDMAVVDGLFSGNEGVTINADGFSSYTSLRTSNVRTPAYAGPNYSSLGDVTQTGHNAPGTARTEQGFGASQGGFGDAGNLTLDPTWHAFIQQLGF